MKINAMVNELQNRKSKNIHINNDDKSLASLLVEKVAWSFFDSDVSICDEWYFPPELYEVAREAIKKWKELNEEN